MTEDGFRKLALALPGAEERAHMNHPDFRVGGKIFATLGYPGRGWAMVKLTPSEQLLFSTAEPDVFVPIKGTWGSRGATNVRLDMAKVAPVRRALEAAWRATAPKRLTPDAPQQTNRRKPRS